MARRQNTKFDFGKAVKKTLISGGVGAVAHVVGEAIDLKDASMIDYGLIVGGAVLPEVVKFEESETVGTALTAVGAYRLAERNQIADKLGFKTEPKASGLPSDYVIGSTGTDWQPTEAEVIYANNNESVKSETQSQVSTVS